MSTLATVATAVGLLMTVASATIAVEVCYAQTADVQQIEYRLSEKIRSDKCYRLRRTLWSFVDRYGPTCGVYSSRCREIRVEMKQLGCK